MELLEYFDLHLVYLVIFSLGISIGVGSALLSNLLFVISLRDGRLSADEYRMLRHARSVVWVGIILYALSGVGLFTISAEAMLGLGIFYADMTIATLMVINACIFQFVYLPILKTKVDTKLQDTETNTKTTNLIGYLVVSETVSVVSWIFIILHHAMYRLPASYAFVMTVYLATLLAVGLLFCLMTARVLTKRNILFLKRVGAGLLVLMLLFGWLAISGVSFSVRATVSEQTDHAQTMEDIKEDAGENSTYTLSEVAEHNTSADCWVVIDGVVYDVTPAAEKYPEVYACGTDTTENYRKIREEGVSDRVKSYEIGLLGFPAAEVAKHDNKNDCWLIIDDLVFDMTEASKLHPAAFNCGTDASENYHRNHGKGISDKQMEFFIGAVDDGIIATQSGNPEEKVTSLHPTRELYVDEGSWDNKELMVIVEKDAEKLLFIDGSTQREIGRVHDIGFQPHTSVFSADARYMFIISRDGWLTKIDLNTLQPVKSVNVGESSRGTALTEDGRYIAVGNYIPGNIVILDTDNLDIQKTIPAAGEINGEEVESRVGAMIESGNKIIAALKDLNSVWVIDTEQSDFPVIAENWNIGENETPLHDAFLTPDGRYYIVASMGSDTVWVMDTQTWKPIKEVQTGKTPHTGPGAYWGNKVYVPAMGEGLITSIDTTTWEPVNYIKTAGPGLFVRSFTENPDYPYVWAETAFGDYKDEIYVIDARTDEIVKTIKPVEGESSWHPEFTNDGQQVYVVSQTANEVEVYDAWTFELIKRFEANTPSAVSNVGNRIEEKGL